MVIYEKCPECGKKGFRRLYSAKGCIDLAIIYGTTDISECKYCGYEVKGESVIPHRKVWYLEVKMAMSLKSMKRKKRESIKQIFNPIAKRWEKIDFSTNKSLGTKKTPYKSIQKVK